MPLFDRYIAVDWSANSKPKTGKDSIWSASSSRDDDSLRTENHATRHAAELWLGAQLTAAVGAGERVLVGLDFPYGYPSGFAAALGQAGEPWKAIWRHLAACIEDDERNASNRFAVAAALNARLGSAAPFWGRPVGLDLASLPMKKEVSYRGPDGEARLPEWRQVEQRLRQAGSAPQTVWKLAGAGSVGSQTLVGIPVLQRLRSDPALRAVSRVWPFEIGVPELPAGVPAVVHAEIWPSIVPFAHEDGVCRDEQQVRAVVACWRELDQAERLGEWFAAPDDDRVRREEGWVLGVPAAPALRDAARAGAEVVRSTGPPARPRPGAAQSTRETPSRPPCSCGCGGYPRGKRSRFMPGHDQRRNPATGRPFNQH